MNNLRMDKKAWAILAGTILIVAASIFLYYQEKNARNKPKPLEVKTSQLDQSDTPSGFPKDLPIERGSEVLQNYETHTNDGRLQSTKQFTVQKEARAALDFYTDYFKKLGYDGGYSDSSSTEGGQQIALMQNKSGLLMIVATSNGSKQSTVELTLTQRTE